jgi:hypothetical protein
VHTHTQIHTQTNSHTHKQVYSWQGVNALELWARVLGAHADKAEIKPLVYPLTQVCVRVYVCVYVFAPV